MEWSYSPIWLLLALALLLWIVKFILNTIGSLHILQLEGYKSARFWKWCKNPKLIFSLPDTMLGIIIFVCGVIGYIFKMNIVGIWIFFVVWIAGGMYLLLIHKRTKAKKPLVFTPRAIRLLTTSIMLMGLIVTGVFYLSFGRHAFVFRFDPDKFYLSSLAFFVGVYIFTRLSTININIANILIYPLESLINLGYLNSARRKINQYNPYNKLKVMDINGSYKKLKVIGITGSYGKTSIKHILNSILSTKYNILMTPESYNTPMGICKVIRGELKPEHEIFVVEMGAYSRGEIKELCSLVQPQIGILTSIGTQHLERFKSVDTIVATKYELIESLPKDGVAIFNNDNEYCHQLANKTKIKTIRYGIKSREGRVDLLAKDISSDREGVRFTLERDMDEKISFQSRLLGRHNVSNILGATAAALECGLTVEEIKNAVKKLEPVPHRLQLIQGAGGVTVIDDAYNANPIGAMEALEVLGGFNHGAKILVTPGLIELGDHEFEENKILGANAARVCDFVFLVGPKRTLPIMEGLKQANFPEEQIVVVRDLEEATARLKEILKPGDVVLFENDLPDNYNEE